MAIMAGNFPFDHIICFHESQPVNFHFTLGSIRPGHLLPPVAILVGGSGPQNAATCAKNRIFLQAFLNSLPELLSRHDVNWKSTYSTCIRCNPLSLCPWRSKKGNYFSLYKLYKIGQLQAPITYLPISRTGISFTPKCWSKCPLSINLHVIMDIVIQFFVNIAEMRSPSVSHKISWFFPFSHHISVCL